MTMPEGSPLHAGSLVARLARFIRSAKRLIGAWRDGAAVNRELSALSDRLLTDIGVDSRRLREIARAKELGSPSRTAAATEVAQGAPAQDRAAGIGRSAPPSAISNRNRPGPGNRHDPSLAAGGPASLEGAPGARRGGAPIRLVPRGGFRE